MEDIFTVLLIIGTLVFTFLQKKSKEAILEEEDDSEESDLPDLEEVLPQDDEPKDFEKHSYQPIEPDLKSPSPFITKVQPINIPTQEKEPVRRKANPRKNLSKEKEENTPSDFRLDSIEEIRRGIIWSEILKRKF